MNKLKEFLRKIIIKYFVLNIDEDDFIMRVCEKKHLFYPSLFVNFSDLSFSMYYKQKTRIPRIILTNYLRQPVSIENNCELTFSVEMHINVENELYIVVSNRILSKEEESEFGFSKNHDYYNMFSSKPLDCVYVLFSLNFLDNYKIIWKFEVESIENTFYNIELGRYVHIHELSPVDNYDYSYQFLILNFNNLEKFWKYRDYLDCKYSKTIILFNYLPYHTNEPKVLNQDISCFFTVDSEYNYIFKKYFDTVTNNLDIDGKNNLFSSDNTYSLNHQQYYDHQYHKDSLLCYLYDIEVTHNSIVLKFFEKGFVNCKKKIQYFSNQDFEYVKNFDSDKYSKKSKYYSENFKSLKFDFTHDIVLKIGSNEKIRTSIIPVKKILKKMISDMYKVIFIGQFVIVKKSSDFNFNFNFTRQEKKNILFCDRYDKADDSAEVLYKYFMDNSPYCNIYFVIKKDSVDYTRLKNIGYNLVDFGSEDHKEKFINAKCVISSHADPKMYNPIKDDNMYISSLCMHKFVFLQHGVIMHDHSGFLDSFNTKIDLFISSSEREKSNIVKFSDYKNVVVTGLCRFDNYNFESEGSFITYAPSWNTTIEHNFAGSKYFDTINQIINSYEISQILRKKSLVLKIVLHPNFMKYSNLFSSHFDNIVICKFVNYREILSESKLLITDYSSLLFDVLYQNRPVLSFMPYSVHHIDDMLKIHWECIDKITSYRNLVDKINYYMNNDFTLSKMRRKKIRELFTYQDNNNSKRVYEEVVCLLDNKINADHELNKN